MRSELYQIKYNNSDDVTEAAKLMGNGSKDEGDTQRWPLDVEYNEVPFPNRGQIPAKLYW